MPRCHERNSSFLRRMRQGAICCGQCASPVLDSLRPGFQNWLTESRLPSGSLNQATLAPLGAVQMPSSRLHHALECLKADAGLGEITDCPCDIRHLPAKHSIGRGATSIDQRHPQHRAGAVEFERERAFGNQRKPEDVAEEAPGSIGIGRRDEGDERRAAEHGATLPGMDRAVSLATLAVTTYHHPVTSRRL